MQNSKSFFEIAFSSNRMKRYYDAFPDNHGRAISLYEFNLKLSESLYIPLSVLEVTLRNAINKQLVAMMGKEDWYSMFSNTPGLTNLNRYITQATKQIANRHEPITSAKIIAELTLGFWVTLFNSEYEKILWKDLRKCFPNLAKKDRQRKKVSAPLNRIRSLRNRIFHNEAICWNVGQIRCVHNEIMAVMEWLNKDAAIWLEGLDRFNETVSTNPYKQK